MSRRKVEIDDDDIVAAVGRRTYDKGVDLWSDDAVLSIATTEEGTRIKGKVQGSRDEPYAQTIHLTHKGGRLRIIGGCTCPVSVNCKHVAAVLLGYREQQSSGVLEAPPVQPATPASLQRVASAANAAALSSAGKGQSTGPQSSAGVSATVAGSHGISVAVRSWLDRVVELSSQPSEPAERSQPGQRRALFVLQHELAPGEAARWPVRLRPISVAVGRDGGAADVRHLSPDIVNRPAGHRPSYISEEQFLILRDLDWLVRSAGKIGVWDVPLGGDAVSRRVLAAALEAGCLHLGRFDGPLLGKGPAVRGETKWQRDDRGQQRLVFVPVPPGRSVTGEATADPPIAFDAVLGLAPPVYVDIENGRVGEIETDFPASLAAAIASAPDLGPVEAALVREVMRARLPRRRGSAGSTDGARRGGGGAKRPAGATMGAARATPPRDERSDDAEALALLLPLPEAPSHVEVRVVTPTPRLQLLMTDARLKPAYRWHAQGSASGSLQLPIARLSFDYAGEIVAHHVEGDAIERVIDGRLVLTRRDARLELQALERLKSVGLVSGQGTFFEVRPDHAPCFYYRPANAGGVYEQITQLTDTQTHLAFATEVVPALTAEGWQVVYAADYPYRIAEGETSWWVETGEATGIDWFSFEVGIEFEGHRISLVPELAKLVATLPPEIAELAMAPDGDNADHKAFLDLCGRRPLLHVLPDGRILPLPGERMAPLVKSMIELIGPRPDTIVDAKMRLHRAEVPALAEFAERSGLDVTWAADAARLVALGKDLRRGRALEPVQPPADFRASLRPYQSEGLAWLDFLRSSGFGGVLADDMGLGKTVQALAFLAREKAEGRLDKPAIILAPTSVLPNWQAEAHRFAPELRVLALRGLERKELFGQIGAHDLVLSTYPLLARDHEVLLAHEYHAAILDEAQAIKNPKANVSALAHRINARHRIALTGTPLENNLGEVWSLFEFLSPGLLGDESTFRRTFRSPIEKHGDPAAQAFLTRRLKPFMLRRTKQEVAKELPPKTEIVERVRIEGPQRDLYETVRSLMHQKVREEVQKKGLAKSHIVFLDALLKLRQVCCDPRLLKMSQARKVRSSAKLERLMEMLPEMVSEGRRVLLFSQFTSMLALIEEELAKARIPYVMLTGDTEDRATPVREFQAGKVPLFLLSLKAGGTGLNLTAADTVIHYDPWWNPAVENQATDRAYRIGQDKPVFVYKLIVEEGIEEAIELLKARKAALAEALFAGSSKSPLDLTEADISALFAPLGDVRQLRKAA